MKRPLALASLALALSLSAAPSAHPWGGTTHRYVAENWSQHLPPEMDGLAAWDGFVSLHVMDADSRKSQDPNERFRHYMDIDAYPEFFDGTLSHDRAELEARYGVSQVLANGIVPWVVGEVVETLSAQMAAGEWDAAALTIADLCHYVGDAHVPLHATVNFDGQHTGNTGIHARWESEMMNRFAGELFTPVLAAEVVASPVDALFEVLEESWAGVETILAADDTARALSGGSFGTLYYQALWHETEHLARERVNEATRITAALVRTAWVTAGEPPVPGSSVDVTPPPAPPRPLVLRVSPNPFTGFLRLAADLPGPYTIEVLDARGARVATLARDVHGAASYAWRPETDGLPRASGLYYVRARTPGGSLVRPVVFLR